MLSRAQIGAFAARVNLRSRDINGAVNLGGESRIEPADAPQAQVLRCAGASVGKQPYRVSSPVIETGRGARITSTVLALLGSASAAATAALGAVRDGAAEPARRASGDSGSPYARRAHARTDNRAAN
jgi:hypothetical protein